MRLLVTILGFVVALLVFRFFVEEAWPSAIYLGKLNRLIGVFIWCCLFSVSAGLTAISVSAVTNFLSSSV